MSPIEYIESFKVLYLSYFPTKTEKAIQTDFTTGGCYLFARLFQTVFPSAKLMRNHTTEHCAVLYDGVGYDITGRISLSGFCLATKKDDNYMKKYYRPLPSIPSMAQFLANPLYQHSYIQKDSKAS